MPSAESLFLCAPRDMRKKGQKHAAPPSNKLENDPARNTDVYSVAYTYDFMAVKTDYTDQYEYNPQKRSVKYTA